jgi:acyl phosphate:glycerol-3-phosphate acyltransferase
MLQDEALAFAISAVVGYLLGSIPFGLVIVKLAGLGDIRSVGSGNIGATNVLRTGRKDLALATLLLDSGKAAVALLVFQRIWGQEAGFVAGFAAFVGHCFPIWLRFKGGKGVATFFGMMLAGLPLVGIMAGVMWLVTAITFRFSSLGALVATAAAPFLALVLNQGEAAVIFCAALAIMIWWLHRANIARLFKGEEPKIGGAKAAASADPAAAE